MTDSRPIVSRAKGSFSSSVIPLCFEACIKNNRISFAFHYLLLGSYQMAYTKVSTID